MIRAATLRAAMENGQTLNVVRLKASKGKAFKNMATRPMSSIEEGNERMDE